MTHKNTQTQFHTPIPDKPYNERVDVALREDAQSSASAAAAAATPLSSDGAASGSYRKSASHANDEYTNDSLEFNATNNGPNRNNSDGITEGDDNDTIEQDSLFDTAVEQDSLETGKVAVAIETNAGGSGRGSGDGNTNSNTGNGVKPSQFLPFAHIGTNWSNEAAAAQQISTVNDDRNCSNKTTNQFIEIESTNPTNAFVDVQTNQSSIINKQTSENEYQVIPGIYKHIHITPNHQSFNKFLNILKLHVAN